jgi:hypothetical protein
MTVKRSEASRLRLMALSIRPTFSCSAGMVDRADLR